MALGKGDGKRWRDGEKAAGENASSGALLPKDELKTIPPPPRSTSPAIWAGAGAVGGVVLCIGLLPVYKRHFRRIPNVSYIKPQFLGKKTLYGKVTSVGDGDGFHLYHTPGGRLLGWSWLPWRQIPTESQLRGKKQTISVRIAGVDAPEREHFGRPSQPYSEESLAFLKRRLLGKYVRVLLLENDRYQRIVGSATFCWWVKRRDIGLEMIKAGAATVYEAKSGVVFPPGLENAYRTAEAKAKQQQRGLWKGLEETPRQFKERMTKAG